MIATRTTALAACALLLAVIPTLSQDDISGDIPAGPPFDGSVDRASMFDLEQIASLAYNGFAGQSNTADGIRKLAANALEAHGYGGTKISVTLDFTAPDRSCAKGEQIETRIRYSPSLDAVEVVAAARTWVAALAHDPSQSNQLIKTPAQDCVPD